MNTRVQPAACARTDTSPFVTRDVRNQARPMRFLGRIGCHAFEGPAIDRDECDRVTACLGRNNVLILRNHGLLEWPALRRRLNRIDASYAQ